jgi:4-amino-4-deoxy-L-arabinose transferase-like glycosyltransferase
VSDRARTGAALVIAAAALFLPNLFLRGLWSPDEPRYAAVAWQMRTSGDYLVPRINGQLYPEKPPLFFWLAALGDLAAPTYGGRIVEVLAMLALGLVLARLAGEPRLATVLILFSCLLSLDVGKFGVIDALLILCMVGAIACGRAALGRERPAGAWLGCYAALALGCLVKGPVIIPFTVLALAGSLADVPRRATRGRHVLGHLLGLGLFALIVAAWLVPACLAGGREYTEALLGQLHGRISGERKTHIEPWHYYLVAYTFTFFPWTLVMPAALVWAARQGRKYLWAILWFLAGFALLSSFASKRERYLFLILPAGVLLLAHYLAAADPRRAGVLLMRATAAVLIAASCVLVAAGALVPLAPALAGDRLAEEVRQFIEGFTPWELWVVAPLFGLSALAGGVIAWRSAATPAPRTGFAAGVFAFVAAGSLAFDTVITPRVDPIKTGAAFAAEVRAYSETGGALYLYDRHFDGRFNLVLRRLEIPVTQELPRGPEPAAVICGWRDPPEGGLPPPFEDGFCLATGPLGGRTMYLVGNRAAAARFRRSE